MAPMPPRNDRPRPTNVMISRHPGRQAGKVRYFVGLYRLERVRVSR